MKMDDFTVQIGLTPAQARVAALALNMYEAVINGDVDGKRRCPWDHFAMDADEGIDVPGALTDERSFRVLLDTARDSLGQAASQH